MRQKDLERICALPMFAGVSLVDVRCVLTEARARVRTFRRHETVFAMQSEVRHVFVILSLNRQEFADLLGVHRAALSRTLSQLVSSGQIAFRKNVFRLLK